MFIELNQVSAKFEVLGLAASLGPFRAGQQEKMGLFQWNPSMFFSEEHPCE